MTSRLKQVRDWYTVPASDISGFLLDVKAEIRTSRGRRVSGIILFFLTETFEKYAVFLPWDPYFLVTYANTTADQLDRSIRNCVEVFNDQGRNQRKKVVLRRIEQVWRHDTEHPLHRFLEKDTVNALKLIFEVPGDIPKMRDHVRKISGVKSVREDDVLYIERVLIDTGIRVGRWYRITLTPNTDVVATYDELPIKKYPPFFVLGWDIETLHQPLQSPDPEVDQIYMVQVCFGEKGYLIINRAVLDHDPKLVTKVAGDHVTTEFTSMVVDTERELIDTFLWVLLTLRVNGRRPDITSAHNSDKFDWWFINERAKLYNIKLRNFGIEYDERFNRCKIPGLTDLDTFLWVQNFSYSAKGEQGAKAICAKHLGYEPDELDHERVLHMIDSADPLYDPLTVCEYGGSDAQITYLLASKIVANFAYALSSTVATTATDILRKGASSSAELLFLANWHNHDVIAANKMRKGGEDFFEGYWVTERNAQKFYPPWAVPHQKSRKPAKVPIEKVSYKGAEVELSNVGVYRNDLDYDIQLNPDFIIDLINKVDGIVDRFCDRVEQKRGAVKNRQHIKKTIREKLKELLSYGLTYHGKIMIWHVDVKAMYPNIVLTWKLQPHAVVTPEICGKCDRNTGDCWVEEDVVKIYKVILASAAEVKQAENICEREKDKDFTEVVTEIVRDHKKRGVRKIRKIKEKIEKQVKARFCQKAHELFVDSVRELRDLRYIYKNATSQAFKEAQATKRRTDLAEEIIATLIRDLGGVRDWNYNMANSLKTILNAGTYGYLYREASRALSFEVVGATTIFGGRIILHADALIVNVGGSIELDSLDSNEYIILKDQNGYIRVERIGDFVDGSINANGAIKDGDRCVEYGTTNWSALTVSRDGKVSFKPIKTVIRQKRRDARMIKIKTPMAECCMTPSHSLFKTAQTKIIAESPENLSENDFVAHIKEMPNTEIDQKNIRMFECDLTDELSNRSYIFVPKEIFVCDLPISRLKLPTSDFASTSLMECYKIPLIECQKLNLSDAILERSFFGTLKSKKYPALIKFDKDLASLIGWFVSEGWCGTKYSEDNDSYKYYAGVAQKDEGDIERIRQFAQGLCPNGGVGLILSDKVSRTWRVSLDNIFFYHIFHNVLRCGSTHLNKRIPKEILSANRSIKESFLSSYHKGDGYKTLKTRLAFSTTSEGLKNDLLVLGRQLGYITTPHTYRGTNTPKYYVIDLMSEENWKRGSRSHYASRCVNGVIGVNKFTIIDNGCPSNGYVYDLSIDGNENFVTADGLIAHNTDGVHLFLPTAFPVNFPNIVEFENGDQGDFNFLLEWINEDVQKEFTNENYWTRDADGNYVKQSLCEIEFDIDGPVDTFISLTKKKYAIVSGGKIVEVKGLEKKRKGELQFIKDLYDPIIFAYTQGTTLEEAYQRVYEIIEPYIKMFRDHTISLDLLSEARDLSMHPSKYKGKQKYSCAAKKYEQMGLDYVIGTPMEWYVLASPDPKLGGVTDRSIPAKLFQYPDATITKWLKKWLKVEWSGKLEDIIDWDHYFGRFAEFVDRVIGECSRRQGIKLDLPTASGKKKKGSGGRRPARGRGAKDSQKLTKYPARKESDIPAARATSLPKRKSKRKLTDFM